MDSRTAMTWLPSQKRGGMTLMTGVLPWMAISSSEGIGKEREAVGWPCMLRTASIVQSLMVVMTRWNAYE